MNNEFIKNKEKIYTNHNLYNSEDDNFGKFNDIDNDANSFADSSTTPPSKESPTHLTNTNNPEQQPHTDHIPNQHDDKKNTHHH